MFTCNLTIDFDHTPNAEAVRREAIRLGGKPRAARVGSGFAFVDDVPVHSLRHRITRFGTYRVRKLGSRNYVVEGNDATHGTKDEPPREYLASVYRDVREWVRAYIEEHFVTLYSHAGVDYKSVYWPKHIPDRLSYLSTEKARPQCFVHTVRAIVEILIEHQGWDNVRIEGTRPMWCVRRFTTAWCPDIVSAFRREFGLVPSIHTLSHPWCSISGRE